MALEHLSDEDLQALKERGLVGVSDEGLQLLKLPSGHGMHPDSLSPDLYNPVVEKAHQVAQEDGANESALTQIAAPGAALAGGLAQVNKELTGKLEVPEVSNSPMGRLSGLVGMLPQTETQAGLNVVMPAAGALAQEGVEAAAPTARKIATAAAEAFPKLKRMGQGEQLINDFDNVMNSPTVKEMKDKMASWFKSRGLTHMEPSLEARFGSQLEGDKAIQEASDAIKGLQQGKVVPVTGGTGPVVVKQVQVPAQATGVLDAAGNPIMTPGKMVNQVVGRGMGPQEAVDGIQAIGEKLRNPSKIIAGGKEWGELTTSEQGRVIKELQDRRSDLIDFLESLKDKNGNKPYAGFRDLQLDYKRANTKADSLSFFPKNLKGDPDVLKAWASLTGAGAAAGAWLGGKAGEEGSAGAITGAGLAQMASHPILFTSAYGAGRAAANAMNPGTGALLGALANLAANRSKKNGADTSK